MEYVWTEVNAETFFEKFSDRVFELTLALNLAISSLYIPLIFRISSSSYSGLSLVFLPNLLHKILTK